MRWPFKRRAPRPASVPWAREVVATIPRADLGNHVATFAHALYRSKDPERRSKQFAKLIAIAERVDELERRLQQLEEEHER